MQGAVIARLSKELIKNKLDDFIVTFIVLNVLLIWDTVIIVCLTF